MAYGDPPIVFDNSGKVPLKIPGLGDISIYYTHGSRGDFRTGHDVDDDHAERLTFRELGMIQLMEALTEKPDWQRKIRDPDVVGRWKAEALSNVTHMTDKAFDWCMRELEDKAARLEKDKYILTLEGVNLVLKSDLLMTSEFVAELKQAVQPLLKKEPKDWHPRSNDQVLNLIHPSLYPLVYGKTRILSQGTVGLDNCWEAIGKGDIIPPPALKDKSNRSWEIRTDCLASNRFQWLPCEVAFKGDTGTDVEITSYINNLPPTPDNKALYRVIEKAISLSVEPWNQVVVRQERMRVPMRIDADRGDQYDGPEAMEDDAFDSGWWEDSDERESGDEAALVEKAREYWHSKPNNPLALSALKADWPEGLSEESTFDEVYERLGLQETALLKHRLCREYVIPEPGEQTSYEDWASVDNKERYTVNLEKEFRDKGLQVIVKLASIELTPDKPSYPGGNWHLEGLLNERIAATAIMYYDVENITESRIDFRYEASCQVDHGQEDHYPMAVKWGAYQHKAALQDIGSVPTRQGRLIAFPNTLQHRVEPFELEDKTKPGHRRLLVLWLVDPNYRIASTRNVPPQQQNFSLGDALSTLGGRLPAEVVHQVHQSIDWGMSEDEAKALRLELMDERSRNIELFHEKVNSYNFCEH